MIKSQLELTHTKNAPVYVFGKTFIAIQCQKIFTKICHRLVQTTIKKISSSCKKSVQIIYTEGLSSHNIK